jgi:hypothetical protein
MDLYQIIVYLVMELNILFTFPIIEHVLLNAHLDTTVLLINVLEYK